MIGAVVRFGDTGRNPALQTDLEDETHGSGVDLVFPERTCCRTGADEP